MKKLLILLLLSVWKLSLYAENYNFEQVQLIGVENPVSVALSPDGLKMVLVDQPKKGNIQVKQCYRPYLESKWGAAQLVDPINKLVTKDTRVEGFCFSYNNKYLYFAANFEGSVGGMDIYYLEIQEDGWSDPKNLGDIINTSADENYPSVSGNERTIFFTRELSMKRLENFHTGELYKSEIDKETEQWIEPEKINKQINSGGIAYSKIYDDNKTIFYSCITDEKEGWRIYWTKRLNDLHWYLPVCLDTLTSKDSEISPAFCKQDQYLYYIKYDFSGFTSKGELFRYKLDNFFQPDKTIKITGTITNSVNNEPVPAKVLVTDPVLGRVKFLTESDENGNYTVLVNAGESYMFHVWADRFSHFYQLLKNSECNQNKTIDFKIFPQVTVTLNMFDKEELWPLNAKVVVKDEKGSQIESKEQFRFNGQKKMTLPIGPNYTFTVSMKDYADNQLNLDLSSIVLFSDFIRDIELKKDKREFEIYVTDATNKDALDASVELIDMRDRKIIPEPESGQTGLYKTFLREGEPFDVEVRGPKGFAFKHSSFDLDSDRNLKRLNIELQPLMRKVPIRLNNINFEYNSADLMESSFEELNRVVQLLKENPEIHVEIMAHTDDLGSDRYNNVLADKRAKSVVEYLVINKIDQIRLVARGYGETQPLVPNTSDENRAINRRVEMKILDENDADFFIEERVITE